MTRHRTVALLVIVVGVTLCVLGLSVADQLGPQSSNYDRTIVRAIAGAGAAVVGAVALAIDLRRGRRHDHDHDRTSA